MNQNLLDNLCVFISETKQNNAYDIYNDWAKKNNLRLSYEESKFYVGYINRFIFIERIVINYVGTFLQILLL